MQFSIKHLLAWTAIVAVMCAVLFAVPSLIGAAILGLGLLWLPVVVVCGVIYARGWRRAFFIGSTIAAAPLLFPALFYAPFILSMGLESDFVSLDETETLIIKFGLAGYFGYVVSAGVAAVAARWLVSPREPVSGSPVASAAPPQYAVLHGRLTADVMPQAESANSG